MKITLDLGSIDDYALFLKIKALPRYEITGRTVVFPDEYAERLGVTRDSPADCVDYEPIPGLWDYQAGIAEIAIRRRKFAAFLRCGRGKSLVMTEFIRHAASVLPADKCALMISPLMVVRQTISEIGRFYGDRLPVDVIKAADLPAWLESGTGRIGITNYDALNDDVPQGRLGALALDESSCMKNSYGSWAGHCLRLGAGLEWKLALTGTPAPNDRIEYANHAVFLDAFPTVNSFLARFFINRGQTDNRWELKPHAIVPFYKALADWSIFMSDPATYGWKDNVAELPPIHIHIHDVDLTEQQNALVSASTGKLFATEIGGITSRSVLSQIAKGNHRGKAVETRKPAYIKALVDSWPDESTIIWCIYNDEQDIMERTFPGALSVSGSTSPEARESAIDDFKAGRNKILISKGKLLGYGLNLQTATRHVFSGIQDSYELFHQCIMRSNRYGSTRALNVHLPITEIERPMIETVLSKAKRVQTDTDAQEALFKDVYRR